MANDTIAINVKGKMVSVPALNISGKTIVVRGRWIRVASVHDETWLETELENPEACLELLRGRESTGLKADYFTFAQKPSSMIPKYSYAMEQDSIAAIRLKNFKDWWEKLPQETRKNVRRSQKRGVEIRVVGFDDDLIKGIRDVYNDSPVRQGAPNQHYGKSHDQIKKEHSAFLDRSDFVGAYVGSEMIGFAKLVYRGEVASILNFAPKASHQDKRPANALIAKVVELCDARNVSHVTYGGFNYGHKRDSPLREFKVRNGFEELLVPRYYIPVTSWGALCIKLKLHRGAIGILPESVIAATVSIRGRWYNFKHKPV